MKLNTKIFTKPYTVTRSGVTKTYPSVRPWITNWASFVKDLMDQDGKNNIPVTFTTLDATTGASKSLAMFALGQSLPNTMNNQLIVVPTDNLRQQQRDDLTSLENQGWYTKVTVVETFQTLAAVIKKHNKNKKLSEKHQEILDHLRYTSVVYFDEIHKYSQNIEVVSINLIINFLKQNSLKLCIGVSATTNYSEGWYNLVMESAGLPFRDVYHTRRWHYTRSEAAKDGVVKLPEVVHVNTGLKLDIEIGEFSQPVYELMEKSEGELRQLAKNIFDKTIKEKDPKVLKTMAKANDVSVSMLYRHLRKFVHFRSKACVKMLFSPTQLGLPSLVYVPLREDASDFEKQYNKAKKKLGSKLECAIWHGTSEEFESLDGDSKVIQNRLVDLNDSLKTIVLVGMWKEGTDIPGLEQVHDCGYNPYNPDRTKQILGRLRNGGKYFAYIDVVNAKQIAPQHAQSLIEAMNKTHDSDFESNIIAGLLAGAAGDLKEDNELDQQGEYKPQDCYFDFDNPSSIDLDEVLGAQNITVLGWVKNVHQGETTGITIPAQAFNENNENKVIFTEPMKIHELFKALDYAKKNKVFS